ALLASASLTLPVSTEAGIAVTSHDQSQLTTAHIANVALTHQAPAGWNSVDVGAVGVTGNASESNGVWTIAGAGGDIWGASDAFHFVHRGTTIQMEQLEMRVDNEQNTNAFAKTGLMIRTSLDPGAPRGILDVTPGGNVEFMCRTSPGGEMQYLGGLSVSLPIWLRLSNPGFNSLYLLPTVSTDGVHWTPLNTNPAQCGLGNGSVFYAGAAVTSHDTTTLNTAHVEALSLLDVNSLPLEIGPTGLRGNAAVDLLQANAPLTIEGAGADIWGSSDSFEFVRGYGSAGGASPQASRRRTRRTRPPSDRWTSPCRRRPSDSR
ncbi:MAG TPA: hypothetical protein VN628_03030, partial [Vicinamibacterales bacterium]|nr:hypothetical protein [Vicinamibacterales bacterium]